jgi:cytochrome c oxidase assembly protein subunit 15
VAQISAAQAALPSGPVTHGKAWVEMIHRYLATGVGVLILTLTAATWYERRNTRASTVNPWWPTWTLLWVMLQGAFGALTVTMKLFPLIVTLHLLGGLALLALLSLQAVRYQQADPAWQNVAPPAGLRRWLALALAALLLQVALGGWVSTNYAVMACSDFPLCQGSAWPVMDFATGFSLWRELGLTGQGEMLPFAALTAIHFTHRLFALVALAALAGAAWHLGRVPALRRHGQWLAGLAALQLVTGLSNAVLEWPLLAAVLHTGGAGALVVVLVRAWVLTQAVPVARPGVGQVLGAHA